MTPPLHAGGTAGLVRPLCALLRERGEADGEFDAELLALSGDFPVVRLSRGEAPELLATGEHHHQVSYEGGLIGHARSCGSPAEILWFAQSGLTQAVEKARHTLGGVSGDVAYLEVPERHVTALVALDERGRPVQAVAVRGTDSTEAVAWNAFLSAARRAAPAY